MNFFEKDGIVVGVDEAGRGALAGPVVAAGCIIFKKDEGFFKEYVRDSKKMSKKQRVDARIELEKYCIFEVFEVGNDEIERVNILNATLVAMNGAIEKVLKHGYDVSRIIVDGNRAPRKDCETIIKGDDRYYEIAAASIFAKTYRDDLMTRMGSIFPDYGFDRNFGYGTKRHFEQVKKHGFCHIHRRSWF
ncbi:ribonuclease HII [Candidatus Deianiraea vastatrix]|uniref:Ribonuclease n=1 Tax=Candidatus Deianiraea vastatrix TaxID=2163644 RepID=A0A5B8XFA1_9RICK|nr:ribonuclease HII [Candidatus Deianiraea vastatrix]QED23656.1 Ribonuclease HII [Candidatus Deianiraea vastatrix]